VRLKWQDKSSNETGFQVYVNDASTPPIRAANSTSTDVTGLKPGTKYCFRLEALSSAGSSGKSTEACATTPLFKLATGVDWLNAELHGYCGLHTLRDLKQWDRKCCGP